MGADIQNAAPGTIVAVTRNSFAVATGEGFLDVTEVQLEGKKRMDVKTFLLGNRLSVGMILGN